jgi:hypothetical protein
VGIRHPGRAWNEWSKNARYVPMVHHHPTFEQVLYIISFDLNIRLKEKQIVSRFGTYLILNRRFCNEIKYKS